jgi:hypothetical protein
MGELTQLRGVDVIERDGIHAIKAYHALPKTITRRHDRHSAATQMTVFPSGRARPQRCICGLPR